MNCPKCGARMDYGRICDHCGFVVTYEMRQQMEQQGHQRNNSNAGSPRNSCSGNQNIRSNNSQNNSNWGYRNDSVRANSNGNRTAMPDGTSIGAPTFYGIPEIVQNLKNALVGSAIVWIIIGCIQIGVALWAMNYYSVMRLFLSKSDMDAVGAGVIVYCVIGVANIIVGIIDIVKSTKLKYDYTGIEKKYGIPNVILTYIWNGFVIYAYITSNTTFNVVIIVIIILVVAALLVDFIGIRLFVINHKDAFRALDPSAESSWSSTQQNRGGAYQNSGINSSSGGTSYTSSGDNKRPPIWLFILIPAILIVLTVLLIVGMQNNDDSNSLNKKRQQASVENATSEAQKSAAQKTVEYKSSVAPTVQTEKQEYLSKLVTLIKNKKAFDSGNYVKGDIPPGEYVFSKYENSGSYYEEDDSAGNILDNKNFMSFGYVKVHGAGNLETKGVLVSMEGMKELGLNGAKELYEKLNNEKDWNQSGIYKVGTDIKSGTYLLESTGSAYYEVMSGPVGESEIVNNENFKGRVNVTVENGQYLDVSRATIAKQ